jgi:hypothetical protein
MRASGGRGALEGAVVTLLVVGVFASMGTAGRLVPFHVASPLVFWAFLPALQAIALAVAMRALARKEAFRAALGMHFAGNAPYLLLLLLIAAWCIYVPEPGRTAGRTLPLVAGAVLGTIAWGVWLTFALFRAGLAMARARAALATALYYAALATLFLLYYTTAGQLLPLIPR